jgi:hypothetical protein
MLADEKDNWTHKSYDLETQTLVSYSHCRTFLRYLHRLRRFFCGWLASPKRQSRGNRGFGEGRGI